MVPLRLSPDESNIKEKISSMHKAVINSDPTFLEVFDKVIDKKTLLKGLGNTPASIQKYKRYRVQLVNFLQAQYKRKDICFDQLNLGFMEEFEVYMKTKGACGHNSTMKYIQTLKIIFRMARSRNYTASDPFFWFKIC
jgi:hypothetical protein